MRIFSAQVTHTPRNVTRNLWLTIHEGKQTQEVGRNTRLRLVFPPTLLSCSSRFLRALQQNRAQSRLLYLLSINFKGRITRNILNDQSLDSKLGRKTSSIEQPL